MSSAEVARPQVERVAPAPEISTVQKAPAVPEELDSVNQEKARADKAELPEAPSQRLASVDAEGVSQLSLSLSRSEAEFAETQLPDLIEALVLGSGAKRIFVPGRSAPIGMRFDSESHELSAESLRALAVLGVEPRDLIVSINGFQPGDSSLSIVDLLSSLSSKSVEIGVLRDGNPVRIVVDAGRLEHQ